MQYLVKMTPLEPYCFGTDQSAPYIGAENGGKGTYFIRSKALPEQTTLLGTLRCMILESQGLLKENFDYILGRWYWMTAAELFGSINCRSI